MTGSWRTSATSETLNSTPAASADSKPEGTPMPTSTVKETVPSTTAAGKVRTRANSNRNKPGPNTRKNSVVSTNGVQPPPTPSAPAIAVSPPPPGTPIAKSNSNSGRARGRKASNASSHLAPLSSSATSSSLPPIASAPPNSTAFDIDAMVQRERANLLGHTSKNDWANDDDELPDLDDWDVDNKSTVSSINVLEVKPAPQSIVTAPVTGPGLAAQQRAAKDKLPHADAKKAKRASKSKMKETSPITPDAPSINKGSAVNKAAHLPKQTAPSAPSLKPPPAARNVPQIPPFNPTTRPVPSPSPIPTPMIAQQPLPVQLPKIKPGSNNDSARLPSPVFATLNPPISSMRMPFQRIRGHLQTGDFSPLAGPSRSATNLNERATTKPPSPVDTRGRVDVRLPAGPTSPRKSPGGLQQQQQSHGRSPSGPSHSSPRQKANGMQPNGQSPKSHARTLSATRPKISVSALFQLNRSITNNAKGSSPVRNPVPAAPTVTVD
ncbi:hypothetical protein BKA62DRAFT_771409 [Auriculariales sp. MPI-PUGE-AT-0066]|nr:hypothetical protein BKA62DRAFT_771409 [Auriculariales sp. MPI-PUGE-AT-0066]